MPLVLDMHFVILVVVYGQIVRLRHEVHELVEAVQRLAVFDGGIDMLERPVGKERKLHGEDVQLVKVGVFIEHLRAPERQRIVVRDIYLLVLLIEKAMGAQPRLDLIGVHGEAHPGIVKLALVVIPVVAHADVEAVAEIMFMLSHTDQLQEADGG